MSTTDRARASLSEPTLALQVFREAIKAALAYKDNTTDYLDEVMRELEVS